MELRTTTPRHERANLGRPSRRWVSLRLSQLPLELERESAGPTPYSPRAATCECARASAPYMAFPVPGQTGPGRVRVHQLPSSSTPHFRLIFSLELVSSKACACAPRRHGLTARTPTKTFRTRTPRTPVCTRLAFHQSDGPAPPHSRIASIARTLYPSSTHMSFSPLAALTCLTRSPPKSLVQPRLAPGKPGQQGGKREGKKESGRNRPRI